MPPLIVVEWCYRNRKDEGEAVSVHGMHISENPDLFGFASGA